MRGGTFLALADPMFQNLDYLGNFYTIGQLCIDAGRTFSHPIEHTVVAISIAKIPDLFK